MYLPPYGLVKKPCLDHLHSLGYTDYVHDPTHEYEKLGPRTTKMMFIRYPQHSKAYATYGKHLNGDTTELDYHNVDFLEDEFPSIDEVNKDLKLHDLQEDI